METVEALGARAAAGDRAALEELLREIRPDVLRRCSRVLPCTSDAEDACQEALVAVSASVASFRGDSLFTTWLHTIVTRSAFATYRRMRAAAMPVVEQRLDRADPRRVSVLAGARVDLIEAFERLGRDRPLVAEAVVLRDVAGLDYAEIAAHLAVPLGTVKTRIRAGRLALRDHLVGHGG